MKKLRKYKVNKGKKEGRVQITLTTTNGKFQAWLKPDQAERLAADILSSRFDLFSPLIVQEPKRNREKRRYLSFTPEPSKLGPRPWALSKELLDQLDPTESSYAQEKRAQEQERWDSKQLRKKAKRNPPDRLIP